MSTGLEILGSLVEHESTTTFRMLEPNDFVGTEETAVYEYLKNHYRRYGEFPDIETIETDTGVSIPETPEHVDYYIDRLHQRTVYNGVRQEFGDLRDALRDVNVDEMLKVSNRIRGICRPHAGQEKELVSLSEVSEVVLERYNEVHGSLSLTGISTGYGYLDAQTNGYRNGDLIIWVARPGMGKTHNLIYQARAARDTGHSVLFVSMEMPLDAIGMRFAAQMAGLDPRLVLHGKLSRWGKESLMDALSDMRADRGFNLFAGNFKKNTDDIDTLIQELGPDIIYLDGMYLTKSATAPGRSSRFESAAYVVDELKRITLMRNRPIVASTQFGRTADSGGRKGTLETIGYTDAIPTHASVIVAIKPGRKVLKNIRKVEDGESKIAEVKATFPYRHYEVMKGREGEEGQWASRFQFTPFDFSDVPLSVAVDDNVSTSGGIGEANLDHMQ